MEKFRLRGFDSLIDEETKEVSYRYSIGDSSGLLRIDLTIPVETDEVKFFINQMFKLYRIEHYIVYYTKYKYMYDKGNILKVKMY